MSALDDHSQKYLALLYRYLTIRNRSEKEIRDYLIKKQAEPHVIKSLIALLYEQKFLNDETFARMWVKSRANFKPRGKRMLAMELSQKGIAKEIIEKVLHEENEEIPDELTQAKNSIKKRIEKVKDLPRQEIYQKVGAFLARRGFGWDIIKKAIDESLENASET
jgi:regulatory protein